MGRLMTINSNGSGMPPQPLVAGAPVSPTVAVTWAPHAEITAVARLACDHQIKQWGIYEIAGDGSCTGLADDLGRGNPDVAAVKYLSWSPGGTLAFVYFESLKPSSLPTIATFGPQKTLISIGIDPRTGKAPDPQAATWSPDGKSLVVSAGQIRYEGGTAVWRGPWRIYVVNADGSNPRQITDPTKDNPGTQTYDDVPSWQPCTIETRRSLVPRKNTHG